eukprot:CAMPEP_0185831288 /NCGR_PEP_ID=MMETSP1353-20130828/1399_1 /TAXON_ID=1077150 /ORGANISM="Erythrolobus australicus, Strain CCMP3124" /LENGTH=154 /DNA_ID=CAMNT_0028529335 /DNA_START=598 /DNA_END=1060 /DNA_ORIENTATION=-
MSFIIRSSWYSLVCLAGTSTTTSSSENLTLDRAREVAAPSVCLNDSLGDIRVAGVVGDTLIAAPLHDAFIDSLNEPLSEIEAYLAARGSARSAAPTARAAFAGSQTYSASPPHQYRRRASSSALCGSHPRPPSPQTLSPSPSCRLPAASLTSPL